MQTSLQERSALLDSFILELPFPKPDGMMVSVNDIPAFNGSFITRRWFRDVLSWCVQPGDAPALIPRDEPEDQMLNPWTEEEEAFFCGADGSEPGLPKPKDWDGL